MFSDLESLGDKLLRFFQDNLIYDSCRNFLSSLSTFFLFIAHCSLLFCVSLTIHLLLSLAGKFLRFSLLLTTKKKRVEIANHNKKKSNLFEWFNIILPFFSFYCKNRREQKRRRILIKINFMPPSNNFQNKKTQNLSIFCVAIQQFAIITGNVKMILLVKYWSDMTITHWGYRNGIILICL
jgi:hypothetical protein